MLCGLLFLAFSFPLFAAADAGKFMCLLPQLVSEDVETKSQAYSRPYRK